MPPVLFVVCEAVGVGVELVCWAGVVLVAGGVVEVVDFEVVVLGLRSEVKASIIFGVD